MSRFASMATDPLLATVIMVQASSVSEMEREVTAALAGVAADAELIQWEITGAGDGHTFVTTMIWAPTGTAVTYDAAAAVVPSNLRFAYFLAGDATELARAESEARSRADASDPDTDYGMPLGGASQGTRFMGCVLLRG